MRSKWLTISLGCAAGAVALVLLFARLGHYALWDDEAGTALAAKAVLRTGDTSAFVDDHNILAFANGAELENLRLRYVPPLQVYLTAPFLAVFGQQSALAARLPFVLCGLAALGWIGWWLWRERANPWFTALLVAALLGNVSFFLYARQCRYYSAALLCSLAIVFLYRRWDGRRRGLAGMALFSICLLGFNYLNYLALYVCLAADYVLWGRRERRLALRDWLLLLLPQIIIGAVIVWIWNPLGKSLGTPDVGWLRPKLTLLWWHLRDLDRCEFGALPLLVLAPILYFRSRNPWLLRAPLALLVYVIVVVLFTPQLVHATLEADVRYLVPVIPLCAFIGALGLWVLTRRLPWLAIPLGLLAFGTNLFHGGPFLYSGFRSTLVAYAGELAHPPGDPFRVTSDWINVHVRTNESIWVQPKYAPYPLMFHAPQAVYAWQLTEPAAAQFAKLPDIHFFGRQAPDYVIAFGPHLGSVADKLKELNKPGFTYQPVDALDHYWQELYRPELIWRTFRPITNYDRRINAIYIFQRVDLIPRQ